MLQQVKGSRWVCDKGICLKREEMGQQSEESGSKICGDKVFVFNPDLDMLKIG